MHAIKLLRAMLHKAWPPELKEDSKLNDDEKDGILLKHLLNWPTWQGFLKFFGKIKTIYTADICDCLLVYKGYILTFNAYTGGSKNMADQIQSP